jgi:hypothetical protein
MASKAEIQERKIRKAVIAALKEVSRWKAYKDKIVRDDGLWIKEGDHRGHEGATLNIGSPHHRVPQLYVKLQPHRHRQTDLTRDELTDLWDKMKFSEEGECLLPRPVLGLLGVAE